MCESKVCTKCGIDKSLDNYNKNKRFKDGYTSQCKDCTRLYKQNRVADFDSREIIITHKICTKCNINKQLDEYRIDKRASDGHESACRDCVNTNSRISSKKYRDEHKVIRIIPTVEQACFRCKIVKPLSEYSKNNYNKSGYNGVCKKCLAVDSKIYRVNNAEALNKRSAQIYQRDKEKIDAAHSKYYFENKATIAIRVSNYNKNHPEKRKAMKSQRRGFGHKSINKCFTWCEAHHLHLEDNHEFIINVPCFLHRLHSHNSFSWKNMDSMNAIALDFLINEDSIYKSLYEI